MLNEWFKQIKTVEEDSGIMENNINTLIEILYDMDWDTVEHTIPACTGEFNFPSTTMSCEEIQELREDLTAYYNGHISFPSIHVMLVNISTPHWRDVFAFATLVASALAPLPEWDTNE